MNVLHLKLQGVRTPFLCVFVSFLFGLSACTRSYPYLVTNDDCNCHEYIYRDDLRKIKITMRASYKVAERINSTIEMTFENESTDTLDLGQAYVKGTSENVRYQYNGKSLPLPFVRIEPGDSYFMTLSGADTEIVDDPWLKIAGERITVEIIRLVLGNKMLPPIVIKLVPVNPKFSS